MAVQAIIKTKTIRVGVTALARETGLSQPYVSKLLARGYPPDAIRQQGERARYTRAVRELANAGRPKRLENTH